MVRLAAGIITYQDRPALLRLIKSIYDHVDHIFVIDGRYPSWGNNEIDPPISNDGTKEMCLSLPKVHYEELYAEQIVKRTRYFDLAKEYNCDFLLVVDADDFIHSGYTNWNTFKNYINEQTSLFEEWFAYQPPRQIFNIQFIMTPEHEAAVKEHGQNIRTINLGRLIYKPHDLEYTDHWRIRNKITREHIPYPRNTRFAFIPGLVITSDDLTRPKTRLANDIDYQWELIYKEGFGNIQQFKSKHERQRFEDSILNEVYIWEKYYENTKDKVREVDEEWLNYYIEKEKELKQQ